METAMNPQMTEPRMDPPVMEELARLNEGIEHLDEVVQRLGSSLSFVLGPAHSASPEPGGPQDGNHECSALTASMRGANVRVARIINEVVEIIDRVEV